MEPFSDEDFRVFAKALSDVFDVNHINDLQLWDWRNEGRMMRAVRYAPVPEDCQTEYSTEIAKESTFSIDAHHEKGSVLYTLTFGDMGFTLRFNSLEALIDAMTGVVKSLKLSAKSLGEVA